MRVTHWYGTGRHGRVIEAWTSGDRVWCGGCGTSLAIPVRNYSELNETESQVQEIERWARDHFWYEHGVAEVHSTNDNPILRWARQESERLREETRRLEREGERLSRQNDDDDAPWFW
jgi:hypothetical protein